MEFKVSKSAKHRLKMLSNGEYESIKALNPLKPCPFCGGEAILVCYTVNCGEFSVFCPVCGTNSLDNGDMTEVFEHWQKRHYFKNDKTKTPLLPCPFCAGEAIFDVYNSVLYCDDCTTHLGTQESVQEFIDLWNHRCPPHKEQILDKGICDNQEEIMRLLERAAEELENCYGDEDLIEEMRAVINSE